MHLLIDISHHGFGHLGQTAPVIALLSQQLPGLSLTFRTTVPRRHIASRLPVRFNHVAKATDIGVIMNSLLEVDRSATANAYAAVHANWQAAIDACARGKPKLWHPIWSCPMPRIWHSPGPRARASHAWVTAR